MQSEVVVQRDACRWFEVFMWTCCEGSGVEYVSYFGCGLLCWARKEGRWLWLNLFVLRLGPAFRERGN
jgi:hypothetical protein